MMAGLRRQLQQWLDASIANRISLSIFLLTLGLISFAGAFNFAYLLNASYESAAHDLEEHVRDISGTLETMLNGSLEYTRLLAENPTVVSAVLDVDNQETALFPLLQRSQRRDQHPLNVCITAYNGRSIACLHSPRKSYTDEAWLGKAIAGSQPMARIEPVAPNAQRLLIVYPILYEGTGAAEGLVVVEFDLADTLHRALGKSTRHRHGFDHIHLTGEAGDLFVTGSPDDTVHTSHPLVLDDPLDKLHLRFGVGYGKFAFNLPILKLTLAYLVVSLLIAWLIFATVRRIVPRLTLRLELLTAEAERVTAGNSGQPNFAVVDTSADEIGKLSRAFSDMTERLSEINETLELQVAERTQDLQRQEAYSRALFTHSYIPMVILDPLNGTFIDCNDAAVAIYRLGSRQAVLGKTPLDVSAPTQYDGTPAAEAALCHIREAREKGFHVFEWRHQRPSGEIWDAEVRLMSFMHGGDEVMQFSLRDITEEKRSEAEVWRKANFDGLTGLANRGLCHDRLERALARARRTGHKVGALFIDLDGFKDINDTLGHAIGDELLIQVAHRLAGCVREQDTSCRLGGDEFVFIVPDIESRDDLVRIATEAVALMHQPFTLGNEVRQISGSIGIAIFPDDAGSLEELLERADQALYHAKRAGRNRYAFFSDQPLST